MKGSSAGDWQSGRRLAAWDNSLIVIGLPPSDRLYLTLVESGRLAEQIRQELVCRTMAQADRPVVVADIPLTSAEALELVDKLEDSLMEEEIDWATEGF
jgi:RNase H-fold protein (predicted Holliday junction resolvase)